MREIKLASNEDIICLASGHSMIMGNMPGKLNLAQVSDKIAKDIAGGHVDNQKFGLFDSSQPNYTTYYPDVTAEDLNPTDDEFVKPVFRMLSMTTVHAQWNPISFAKKGVLKDAMNMLIGQTVNVDHETAIGNAIGSVESVEWQNGYTTSDGVKVPGGINAVLKIDAKSNPRLARGIMMTPPSIHSNSVTIRFEWEQSHLKMDSDVFWSKLGQLDEDGKRIQRVANKVISFSETSLVAHGADPFAKKLENGKIVLAKHAEDSSSLSAVQIERQGDRHAEFNYQNIDTVSNSVEPTIPNKPNKKESLNKQDMKELLEKLAAQSGFKFEGEIDKEALMAHLESQSTSITELTEQNTTANTSLTEAQESNATLTATNEELTANVELLTPLSEIGTKHTDGVRLEAKRLYGVLKGDKASEAILSQIDSATNEAAEAMLSEYTNEIESLHEASCSDCGSKNVTKASNKAGASDGADDQTDNSEGGKGGSNTKLTNKQIRDSFKANPNKGSIAMKNMVQKKD